jgi:hypothetical protein
MMTRNYTIKMFAPVLCLGVCFSNSALGLTTPEKGLIFCKAKDHLIKYAEALAKHDKDGALQLKDCVVVKGGQTMSVIETYPSRSARGHIAKVRVSGVHSSFEGYAILLQ